jgi:1-acyl-sn-glycerol-3-phosphate acyltransferase
MYPPANQTSRPRTFLRRVLIVPVTMLFAVIVIMTLPLTIVPAAVIDIVLRRWGFGTVRILLFVAWYLLMAVVIQVYGFVVWVGTAFGTKSQTAWAMRWQYHIVRYWIVQMLAGLRVIVGLRLDVDHPELLVGPSVVAARHHSLADVFVPTGLSIVGNGTWIRVVLTAGLVNEPSIDLFGHRTPQYFIQRSAADMRSEVEALVRLGEHFDDNTAMIIFPEGGLYRPERKEQVIASLEMKDPAQAERGRHLNNLLPPKSTGFSALLDGAPSADVVIVGHHGFEPLTDPVTIWRSVPLTEPAKVKVSRYRRQDVPDDPEGRKDWLNDRWDEMDEWIQSHITTSDGSPV